MSKGSDNINNNKKQGWIKLQRSLQDHWIFENDKYLKRWLVILLSVNHAPKKFNVGNKINICQPGQSYASLETWAMQFRTCKRQVKKFFELLQNDDMILCEILGKGNQRKHLLTVKNWNIYQISDTGKDTEKIPEIDGDMILCEILGK